MLPRIDRRALPPLVALLALLAQASVAADYVYVAETQAVARKQGSVLAGKLAWQCQGSRCTIQGPWEAPGVAACQALAREVGPIRSYGRAGRMLGAAELATCNQGGMVQMPSKAISAVRLPAVIQPTVTGSASGAGLRTGAILFTGTGGPLLPARTAGSLGLRATTAAIRFQGTGILLARTPIEPVTLRVPEITFTGTGSLE
ncbi:MAG: hypothetical protein FJ191_00060 [Gammaproteobacteria bacterium]|nr:hypothetical protein [Gammaproteobacteria bacterium]